MGYGSVGGVWVDRRIVRLGKYRPRIQQIPNHSPDRFAVAFWNGVLDLRKTVILLEPTGSDLEKFVTSRATFARLSSCTFIRRRCFSDGEKISTERQSKEWFSRSRWSERSVQNDRITNVRKYQNASVITETADNPTLPPSPSFKMSFWIYTHRHTCFI